MEMIAAAASGALPVGGDIVDEDRYRALDSHQNRDASRWKNSSTLTHGLRLTEGG
jgi:hypothetical protein